MQFRFRYLGSDGREVQVEGIDALRDLLRSGAVAHDTLLYDALTSEWAPLRAHAVIRLLEDVGDVPTPGEGATDASDGGASPDAAGTPLSADPPDGDLDGLGLDLDLAVDDVPAPSTEETVRGLLKEREREGRDDSTGRTAFTTPGDWGGGLVLDAGVADPRAAPSDETPDVPSKPASAPGGHASASSTPARGTGGSTPASPLARGPLGGSAPARPARRSNRSIGVPGRGAPSGRPAASETRREAHGDASGPPRKPPVAPPTPARPRRWPGPVSALVATGSAGLLALLVYAVAWSDDRPDPPADVASVVSISPRLPLDAPTAVSLVGRSESAALSDMVEALDSLRRVRGLADVPADWLEGIYLSNASRYPEVRSYWERYEAFVDEVRQRDTALFRQSFVRGIEGEGAGQAVVSMRLARAVRLFAESQPERDSVYAAMTLLARTSLDLHELLVEREADIQYDPVLPHRVSRDPVVEAVTDDPLLRDRIWLLLDRIFYSLSVLSGGDVGTRDALTERSLDGIRATGGF